jgi:ribulose kinase
MMQLLADLTGLPVTIPASSQIPARGAAVCAALAAGSERRGFDDFETALSELRPDISRRYEPSPQSHATHERSTRSFDPSLIRSAVTSSSGCIA